MSDAIETAKKLYPPKDDELWYWYDYKPMIDHFGDAAIVVSDDEHQGDTRVLYRDTGNGYGYLQFGWGSCSGCDALQACDSYEELSELIERLRSSIKWAFRESLLQYFKEHDWEGDYSWHEEGQRQFVSEAIQFLESVADSSPETGIKLVDVESQNPQPTENQ